jgi:hypothetical protein
MKVLQLKERALSPKAQELVQFDIDSIRQVVAARHGKLPELWLADPDQYERNGRVLRDSTTPRLLAYSPESRTLYVTDGCNSCAHELDVNLQASNAEERRGFAEKNNIPSEMLERLAACSA